MIEHTEGAFYYGNSDEIKFYEHREFTKLYHKWIIGTRQDEGNSQEETETFFDKQKSKELQRKQSVTIRLMAHIQNFIYVKCKIHFYYQEIVRARSSTCTPFFSKCHLHHRGEELFAIFFCSASTISLLWNICRSVLGHNLSMGKLRPCTPNEKQRHL